MSLATVTDMQIDQAAVLRTLNLNPQDPHTQALLLICNRYGLDPLLKHIVLISGRPYVTRDGYLSIAHESGAFDGIEIVEEGEDDECWWARAAVYRKDMTRPFTYRGRYPKKNAGNPKYGPEMAVKTAEVMALRRAFNVTGVAAADELYDTEPDIPTITQAAAKGRLLSLAGGDKEAAAAAWEKAGLKDHRGSVTEADLAAAVGELHELGWSWAPNGPEDDSAGGAPDSDAGDTPPVEPADAGRADMDTPPAPSHPNSAGQHPPVGLNALMVAMKAGTVFKADYDAAPRGDKTRTVERLRHALTYAMTEDQHTSLAQCTPPQLQRVWRRLDDITEGRLTYDLADDGVTWINEAGERLITVLWTEIEGQPGAGTELPAEAT